MAEIEGKYELDVSNVLDGLEKVIKQFDIAQAAEAKLGKSDPFKEAAKGAANFEKEISNSTRDVVALESALSSYKEEVKKLTAEEEKLLKKVKELEAAWEHEKATAALKDVQAETEKTGKVIDNATQKVGGFRGMIASATGKLKEMTGGLTNAGGLMGRFSGLATTAFGLAAVAAGAVAVAVYRARNSYMEMNDTMLAYTGNQKDVTNNMEVLDTIASQLGKTLRETTSAFAILSNQGIKVTKSELKNIGSLAKEAKTDLVSLSAAIVDADKGQLDSLKKMGFQAVSFGDKIRISFRGVTTEFKKGSGEAAAALSKISTQIEKTENSASGLGRFDFMDRLAKGFVDTEMAIDKASETTDKKAYPAFDRFFNLIKSGKGYVLDMAEAFGVWLGIGWEHIKNDAMIMVAALAYLPDALKNGLSSANKNFTDSKNAFLKNRAEIFAEEKRMQANVGVDRGGELVNGNKLTDEELKALAEAEKKRKAAALKAANERKQALKKAEKDLLEEIKRLRNEYNKDQLEALKGDYLKYIQKKKELDIEEINLEEKKLLLLKQLVSGAKKGKFDADNKPIADKSVSLTAGESSQFDFRRQAATDQEYLLRAKYIADSEREITENISNEYQKQLQAAEYKYEKLFELAKKSGVDAAKLEKAKAKEIEKINLAHQLSLVEKRQDQSTITGEVGVIKAQISGRIMDEIRARKQLLKIEADYIKEKIALIEASTDEEAKSRLAGLYKALGQIELDGINLSKQERSISPVDKLLGSLGFTDEAIDAVHTASSSIASSIGELYSTLNQLSQQRIARIDEEISKKQEQVDRETELNKEGAANNLTLREKELADLQAARERALKDQQRVQRQQMIADTAIQASSMITAASKVFASLAALPFGAGVPLGIAAVALMLGSFAAAKIKAFQLTKNQEYRDGDRIGRKMSGPSHENGGIDITHEVEGGEWVINRRSSKKWDGLLEAINFDNDAAVMDYLLRDLLSGSNVTMSSADRSQAIEQNRQVRESFNNSQNELVEELRDVKKELQDIKKGTNKIPDTQFVNVGEGKIAEITKNSTIVRDLGKF